MLEIRPASESEYGTVRAFYHALIDALEHAEFSPGWEKDIYPTPLFLMESIRNGELYMGIMDGEIVSCMVLNHKCNEGYQKVKWSVDASDKDVLFIHILGVAPEFGGRGIAKDMVRNAFDTACRQHINVLRLDVLQGNTPAVKAYTKMGFQYMDTIQMFYEDTGWTNYELFECVIDKRNDGEEARWM